MDDSLERDKVYTFTGGQVKLANKRYTSIKNDYCLTFDSNTVIECCKDDAQIKGDAFTFTKLEAIENMVQNQTVDVVGIVLEVGSVQAITLKDGSMKDKRTLTIGDEGNVSIMVTLWGGACNANDYSEG